MERPGSARTLPRRHFLAAAGAVALPLILPASARGVGGHVSPGNRIALGFIGLGGHGIGKNLATFLWQKDAQIAALCDVDARHLDQARDTIRDHYTKHRPDEAFQGCPEMRDWRELIARADLDAVVISTPDHWHVLMAVAAARAGKDVFCEKPLTRTVAEGRMLSDTTRTYGRVFQTASENRSKGNFLRAAELVRNGRIGKLHTLYAELPAGHSVIGGYPPVQTPEPVPPDFDFNMWLGPAPEVPYTPGRCHWNFRWILDYSTGNLTDWGAHINDIAQWANNTEYTGPVSVEGTGEWPAEGLYDAPTAWNITFEYANGVRLICTSGTPSFRFEGDAGWVKCGWDTFEASSPELLRTVIGPGEVHLRTCPEGEQRDFLDCVKSRGATYAPAEVGHRSISLSHIGYIAMVLGRKLRWDPVAERFPDDSSANRLLTYAMRAPWRL